MLRVTQSNRLEELAAALAEELPLGDPFARPIVVVSNRLIGRWLQYELARRRGAIGALALPFLDDYLRAALATEELPALDRGQLAALIASALTDRALLAEPALAPVRAYLEADGEEAEDVRRVQLAARVAGHLWDYALTRPDWLDAWDAGRDADAGEVDAATLAWQRRLYEAVVPGAPGALIPRLPEARARRGLAAPAHDPVHLIGFSSLAPAQLHALRVLAAGGDVHVLTVTPCAEYWEDVPGRRRRREVPEEPLALVHWGAPGRDTSGMLLDAVDGGVEERYAPPEAVTVRDAWARDVLDRRAAPAAPPAAAADGVTVYACPSVSRELEIVGSEVWRLLREDPTLRASDVAILLAGDRDRYLAQVGPVLGALHGLPFHLVDAPAAASGRVAEAAIALLELPLGRFTRRELLGVMTHPAVLARHPHVDPADWVAWCERLGIAHGADAGDHRGTYLDGDGGAFHWSQGLERLALGAFVAGPRLGVDAPVALGGVERLPEEVGPDRQPSAATFVLLARSLIADARWLRDRRDTLTRWGEILAAAVETYLGEVDPDGDGGGVTRAAQLLRDLAALDLDRREVPFREVVELARARLGALRASRGEPLVHGVMVAPIEWMRPLPFAAVFVLGLGEGAFPSTDRPSPLDLRTARRPGDVAPRDRDRYGFLEALLAARRHVGLSYVARDEQTGEPLAPSSVIHELAEMLAPYLGAPDPAAALARLTVAHPLRRWADAYVAPDRDPRLTPSASPAAARERHAAGVRRSLDEHLRAAGRAAPDAARLRELLADPALVALRAALRLDLADGAPGRTDDDGPIAVSIATLRLFLESPVQAWARVVLGLEGAPELDDRHREDEPFDWLARERAAVLRESFALALGATGEPPLTVDDAFARVWRRHELACLAPRGPFGAAAQRRDRDRLRGWHDELRERGIEAGPWRRLALGRASAPGAALRPPVDVDVELAGRTRVVQLVGTTELLGGAAAERTLVLVNGDPARAEARPLIEHLVLAASGEATGAREALVLGSERRAYRLGAWTRDDARAQLAALLGELLGQPHAYLLPLPYAKGLVRGKELALGDRPHGFGPIDRPTGLAPPPDAAAIAARRLAPLLARLDREGAS